jgi:hypothetical protein
LYPQPQTQNLPSLRADLVQTVSFSWFSFIFYSSITMNQPSVVNFEWAGCAVCAKANKWESRFLRNHYKLFCKGMFVRRSEPALEAAINFGDKVMLNQVATASRAS